MAESEEERLDRNLKELLEEVRVAVPGVQVLFAFLLVAPFNQRFGDLTSGQKALYLVALVFAGLATACFMAPTAHHRITFRLRDKPRLLRSANRLVIAGLSCLGIAIVAAIGLITGFVFSDLTALLCTAGLALVYVLLWAVYPISRRVRRQEQSGLQGS